MTRVLLTGATGYIASQLLPEFRSRYDLRLVDVRATDRDGEPVDGVQVVDLLEADDTRLAALFEGVDVVVHCAYYRPAGTAGRAIPAPANRGTKPSAATST